MIIRIEDIGEEGLSLEFSEEIESFPVLVELDRSGECKFSSPVACRLEAMNVGGMIEVRGQVQAEVGLTCGRCLKEFPGGLCGSFDLTFASELPEVAGEEGEEGVELTAEDMGIVLIEGEEIGLAETIQEQVVLAVPLRPVCDEGCKGLCHSCGADLNEGGCGCSSDEFNIKFAALRGFKVDKK